MGLTSPGWIIAAGIIALGLLAWAVYERYLHPAWRRQRRVSRACQDAFGEKKYRLERLRLTGKRPTASDLLSPVRSGGRQRYFTYSIESSEEPDYSGLSGEEIRLLKHYLDRDPTEVVHYGKKILHREVNGSA